LPLAATESELSQLLSQVGSTNHYGFQLYSFGDGECTLLAPFRKDFERPGRVVAGPLFMAAADVAMWLAIITRLGISDSSVTAEMKTNFLNAAREEDILCHAKILKLGRRLVYGVAECTNREGKLLTHHTISYIRP
jgi:acyl-coenzyme A thioesterase PaaI-like protein